MNMNKARITKTHLGKIITLLLILCTTSLYSQEQPTSIFDSMLKDGILEVNLRTDIVSLLESASQQAEYQAATISFSTENDGFQVWNLKVKPRGRFRRQNCDFPPLKLNFSKGDLEEKGLADFDKLKLVTHCVDSRITGNESLLREYLTYQLYQEISPYSYRVQLVKIHYVDEQGRVNGFKRYGFIIESTSQLADRLQGEECEDCTYSQPQEFDQQTAAVHAMFQYMVGNADYSIPLLRNVKLIRREMDQKLVPVPYDFDFAGIVGTSYARPAVHMGQRSLEQRIYLGTLTNDNDLRYTIELFLSKKKVLLEKVRRFRKLTGLQRFEMETYLNSFFTQMEEIQASDYKNVYLQLRGEYLSAMPDGGRAIDYGISKR